MALVHLDHGNRNNFVGVRRATAVRAFRRVRAMFGRVHLAIVAAKLRRLRTELLLHRDYARAPEQDIAKYPQLPLIVPDKWNF